MDTEGPIESVHINGVSVLSRLNVENFPQGQSKLSVVMRCPYQAGVCKLKQGLKGLCHGSPVHFV